MFFIYIYNVYFYLIFSIKEIIKYAKRNKQNFDKINYNNKL